MSMSDYFHATRQTYPSYLSRVLCETNARTLGSPRTESRPEADLRFRFLELHFISEIDTLSINSRVSICIGDYDTIYQHNDIYSTNEIFEFLWVQNVFVIIKQNVSFPKE